MFGMLKRLKRYCIFALLIYSCLLVKFHFSVHSREVAPGVLDACFFKDNVPQSITCFTV